MCWITESVEGGTGVGESDRAAAAVVGGAAAVAAAASLLLFPLRCSLSSLLAWLSSSLLLGCCCWWSLPRPSIPGLLTPRLVFLLVFYDTGGDGVAREGRRKTNEK